MMWPCATKGTRTKCGGGNVDADAVVVAAAGAIADVPRTSEWQRRPGAAGRIENVGHSSGREF